MEKKTVQILTFARGDNYGAVLQSYALAEVLRRMGLDVQFLSLRKRRTWRYAIISSLTPLKYRFNSFRRRYLRDFTRPAATAAELREASAKAACCIVGSDQVWNPDITSVRTPFYFFSFLPEGKPRISYAASFGTDKWCYPDLIPEVTGWLREFKAVSVREKAGVEICRDTFGIEAVRVLDPTLLLGDFKQLLRKPSYRDYIVGFMFNPSQGYYNSLERLRQLTGRKVVLMDLPRRQMGSGMFRFSLSPFSSVEGWVTNVANASYVVTDSFHITAFSILFHKEFFYVVNNPRLLSRVTTLLDTLGITGIVFESPEAFEHYLESGAFADRRPIDYESVERELTRQRAISMDFLRNALSDI